MKSSQIGQPASRGRIRTAALLVTLVALSRSLLALAIHALVSGREYSDDIHMHLAMVLDPFCILKGLPEHAQHPPLLPLVEAVFATPLMLGFSPYWALRLTYLAWEVLLALCFLGVLSSVTEDIRARRVGLACFIAFPMGWMTTVVMPQDEVIAATFIMAMIALIGRGMILRGLFIGGIGVIAGKIFVVLPLGALVLLLRRSTLIHRGVAAFALPIALQLFVQVQQAGQEGLLNFSPAAAFGANIWPLLMPITGLSPGVALKLTALIAGGISGGVVLALWVRCRSRGDAGIEFAIRVALISMLWVWAIFYHVGTSYFMMTFPLQLLLARRLLDYGLTFGLATLPWAVNFFYGVANAWDGPSESGKMVFVRLYQRVTTVDPHMVHAVLLILTTLVTLVAAGVETKRAFQGLRAEPQGEPAPEHGQGL